MLPSRSLFLCLALCASARFLSACSASDEGATDAAEPSDDPCVNPTFEAGRKTIVMLKDDDGLERSYTLHVPQHLDRKKPAPLVLNYHGLTSTADEQIFFSVLDEKADQSGFIVAYPEGLGKSFNAGSCCGALASPPNTTDDGAFARKIVADISGKLCVNPRRVYSTGMSNGGYMSEYNACVNADLFAAVAPVSAVGFKQPKCDPSRPIPMIAFNGTADGLVNYDQSVIYVGAWVERNGCTSEPTRKDFGDSFCETWTGCDDGVEVVHCTATGMGHCWPGQPLCPYGAGNTDFRANDLLWDFFKRFELPE